MPTYEESLEETPVFDHADEEKPPLVDEPTPRRISVTFMLPTDEEIVDKVADQIAYRLRERFEDQIRETAVQRLLARVDAVVEPIVMEAVTRPLQPTDAYGNPKGDPLTLLERIEERVGLWFGELVNEQGALVTDAYWKKSAKTRVEWMVAKVVDAVADDKLRKTIDEQVKMAKEQLGSKVTGMVGDAVRKVFGLP